MMDLANSIVKIARKLIFDFTFEVIRDDKNDAEIRRLFSDVDLFLDRIRKNESIDVHTSFFKNGESVKMSLWIGEHKEKKAIISSVLKKMKKNSKSLNLEFKVDDLGG